MRSRIQNYTKGTYPLCVNMIATLVVRRESACSMALESVPPSPLCRFQKGFDRGHTFLGTLLTDGGGENWVKHISVRLSCISENCAPVGACG